MDNKIIANMEDFTNENINKIIKLINNGDVKSLEDINKIIDENAYSKHNNQEVPELDFKSKKYLEIKRIAEYELVEKINATVQRSDCTIKVDSIKIDEDEKLNKLINLMNNKFELINKIF